MLKRVLRLLESVDRDESRAEEDLVAATAELLLEIGRADFEVSAEESEGIASVLESQFQLSKSEAQAYLERAIDASDERVSLYPLTRLMNEKLKPEQKSRLVEQLWDVAYVDNRLDKHEEHTIRRIAELLYVPHHEFIRTKLSAQARANAANQRAVEKT